MRTRKNKREPVWATVDIETCRSGDLLAIGVCTVAGAGQSYTELGDWSQFLRHIEQHYVSRVYAHNGGGFDYLSLLHWIPDSWTWNSIVVNGKIIAIKLKRGDYECSLMDSYRIAPASLDRLARSLLGHGKTENAAGEFIHPEDLYAAEPERFSRYLQADCELLAGCIRKLTEVCKAIAPEFKALGITCGSTAMRLFNALGHDSYFRPEDETLNAVLKLGYRGGRCECFQPGEFSAVNVYDVNSMYPAAMISTPLPLSGRVILTDNFRGRPGIWRVRYSQSRGTVPVLMDAGDGQFSGTGWFYTPEISTALDSGVNVQIIAGYEFVDYSTELFREFVTKLWSIREKYGSDSAMGITSKLLMNNLYGKMGQGDQIQSIFRDTSGDVGTLIESGAQPIDLESDLWQRTENNECRHQHYGIAGTITSYSRAYLYRLMADRQPIYSDTDSIHTVQTMPEIPGLGGLKLEKRATTGIYAGKKIYGLLTEAGESVRIKGVKCSTDNGLSKNKDSMQWVLSLATFRGLLTKKILTAEYRSFPTTLEVLKKQIPPCKLITRRRQIRMLDRERQKIQISP